MNLKVIEDKDKRSKQDYGRKYVMIFDRSIEKTKLVLPDYEFEFLFMDYVNQIDIKDRSENLNKILEIIKKNYEKRKK